MSDKIKRLSTMQVVDGKVKCLDCQKPFFIDMAFRCFFCKVYFCEACAKLHFYDPHVIDQHEEMMEKEQENGR